MAEQFDWKIRWLVIIAGIFIMVMGQGNLFWILSGMAIALTGVYYGTKDIVLAYFKKLLKRLWVYILGFLPPF